MRAHVFTGAAVTEAGRALRTRRWLGGYAGRGSPPRRTTAQPQRGMRDAHTPHHGGTLRMGRQKSRVVDPTRVASPERVNG